MRRSVWWVVALGLVACLAAACGKDEDPKAPGQDILFPAAWAGVWRVHFPYRDCQTDSLLGVDVYTDSICTGETLEEFLGISEDEIAVNCTGTITDTEFAAHCTGRSEELGVVLTITADMAATREDSSFSGGGTAIFRYEFGNSSATDCYELSFDADLLLPVPPDCVAGKARVLARPLSRALVRKHAFQP